MNRPRLTLLLACYLVSSATLTTFVPAQTSPTPPRPTSGDQLRRQVEDLRTEVSDLRKEMEQLTSRIELDEYFLKNKQTKSDMISLDLTSSSYQRLDTDNGFFLVSVEQALPYLNGYKIQLTIGNPSYATYNDYKLKVRWGKQYDWAKYTKASYDEWDKSIQEKEIPFPGALEPGKWNKVEVILAPATAEQLGYLTLSMDATGVILHTQ